VCTPLPLDAGLACLAPPPRCPACGDGIIDPGEVCDDGNRVNGDGCDNNCTLTGCGNGIVTGLEQCDDGNAIDNDGCTNTCQFNCHNPVCGP